MNEAIRMQISAFVDGELPDNEADLLLRRMSQDAALRQEVAEFLAIGRIMRGEASLPGAKSLHDKVMAALDDSLPGEREAEPAVPKPRAIKPLAGVAIAASVALLAIFGLQQTATIGPQDPDVESINVAADAYTVPQPADDQLREYYRSHGATATENGANGMNPRFVTLLRQEALDETASEDQDESQDESGTSRP